jgi:hypothetical protein
MPILPDQNYQILVLTEHFQDMNNENNPNPQGGPLPPIPVAQGLPDLNFIPLDQYLNEHNQLPPQPLGPAAPQNQIIPNNDEQNFPAVEQIIFVGPGEAEMPLQPMENHFQPPPGVPPHQWEIQPGDLPEAAIQILGIPPPPEPEQEFEPYNFNMENLAPLNQVAPLNPQPEPFLEPLLPQFMNSSNPHPRFPLTWRTYNMEICH